MTTTISNPSTASKLGKLGGLFFTRQHGFPEAPRHPGLFAAFTGWLARRRAANELSGLSDRELEDIGLTRQGIPDALRRGR